MNSIQLSDVKDNIHMFINQCTHLLLSYICKEMKAHLQSKVTDEGTYLKSHINKVSLLQCFFIKFNILIHGSNTFRDV